MKRPAARAAARKQTKLRRAVATHVVPKAAKPFALFCKENRLGPKEASLRWQRMTYEEKDVYRMKSSEQSLKQRQAAMDAGLPLRKAQLDNTPVSSPSQPEVPESKLSEVVFAGEYILLSSNSGMGHGGYGGLMKVRHRRTSRVYIAKVSTSNSNLHDEVEILRQLQHECFLPVLAFSVVPEKDFLLGQMSFMIMPLVQSGCIHRHLHIHGVLEAEEQLGLIRQVVSGLAHMHLKTEHIHGDIKPTNILFDPNTCSFWIIDFGLTCRLPLPDIEEEEVVVYTDYYRPPEVAKALAERRTGSLKAALTFKAESWSLGMTLHEAATRRNLFGAGKLQASEKLSYFFDCWNAPEPPKSTSWAATLLSKAMLEVADEVRPQFAAMTEPMVARRSSCVLLAQEMRV